MDVWQADVIYAKIISVSPLAEPPDREWF